MRSIDSRDHSDICQIIHILFFLNFPFVIVVHLTTGQKKKYEWDFAKANCIIKSSIILCDIKNLTLSMTLFVTFVTVLNLFIIIHILKNNFLHTMNQTVEWMSGGTGSSAASIF